MSEKLPNLYLRLNDLLSEDKWPVACKPPRYEQKGVELKLYIPAERIRELIDFPGSWDDLMDGLEALIAEEK